MSDYITLNLSVDIITKNIKRLKSKEFYKFLDKFFYYFRRTEQILIYAKNLISTSIIIQYDEKSQLKTLGSHLLLDNEK